MRDVQQLQAFLRAAAGSGRDRVRIAPFEAFFDPRDELKYLNYAVPDDGATPTQDQIEKLRAAFRERDRLPRLEWIQEAAPAVAAALEAAGMREELSTSLMACTPQELQTSGVEAEIRPVTPDEALEVRNMLRVAFGQPPFGQPPFENVSAETPERTLAAWVDGTAAAAASWTTVIEGVSEVAGVATAEPFRRRGLGGALTAAAAKGAFGEGAKLCVLSPGDETAMRVYERAGFGRVATMLHWSDAARSAP